MDAQSAVKTRFAAALGCLLLGTGLAAADPVGAPSIPLVDDFVRNGDGGADAPEAGPGGRRVSPGQFGQAPTQIPSPFLKNRTVTPRTPDLKVPLNERASVGVFQEFGKIDTRTLLPGRNDRDAAAGLTLQYRFGSH